MCFRADDCRGFALFGKEMTDANLDDLDEDLYIIYGQWLAQTNKAIAPSYAKAIITWRDPEDQNKAFAAGKSNARAGESPHNVVDDEGRPASCAFDYAIYDKDGNYCADGEDPRYATAGHIGEGLGLVWGGRFTKPDFDHLELKNWKS